MTNERMVEIGKRIRLFREQKGMSQDDLAKEMGYASRSSINKVECGQVRIPGHKLTRYAKILGVSETALLGMEESEQIFDRDVDQCMKDIESLKRIMVALGKVPAEQYSRLEEIINAFVEE